MMMTQADQDEHVILAILEELGETEPGPCRRIAHAAEVLGHERILRVLAQTRSGCR
jgi:hypothetical protein